MSGNYFKKIEKKWKERIDLKSYESNPDEREKYFITAPFPYVNGRFHIGHGYTYARHDVIARFKRLQGYNVLFPFAFHATGEPILGVAERLKRGDKAQIKALKMLGVSEKELGRFDNPEYIAEYWQRKISEDIINFGISADTRRSFSTIDNEFKQFITWQYLRLKEMGYVIKGTHPVVYCPHDESPTGDHDRLKGEGEYPVEYTLLKFEFGNEYLIAATLRPETVYGQTNLWVRKNAEYVKAEVNGEIWILSRHAVENLKNQLFDVKIIGNLKGSELLNKEAKAPVIHRKITILPAEFIDMEVGTGIVTSVPSDAPYDYIALKDLKSDIKPIRIIETKKYGDFAAKRVVDELKISSQKDSKKLEEATSRAYKAGFHTGKMIVGKYSGMRVEEAKEKIKAEMLNSGEAEKMYELSGKVVCRCSTECIVKIIENQWFLDFGNEKWKKRARACLELMKIYPDEARNQFEATIEWLKEKACARKSGLGTPLPWDKEWIVETLSDSTIYMAFYTIKNVIRKHKVSAKELTPEVFDYIFLNKKIPKSKIPKEVLEEMKEQFEYYYGVDMRGSAKELVPNHLSFYIFHHVAMFDKKYWPKYISVNGMVRVEGEKMSKSKGNFIVLDDAITMHGADLVRIALMDSVEGMADPDYSENSINAWAKNLRNLERIIDEDSKNTEKRRMNTVDTWFKSHLVHNIKTAINHLEKVETRSALMHGFHKIMNEYAFYRRRVSRVNEEIFRRFADFITKFMSCFTPYFAQELWSKRGQEGFIHMQKFWQFWETEDAGVNRQIDASLKLESQIISDIGHIKEIIGKHPEKITIIVADKWKYPLVEKIKKLVEKRDKNIIGNAVKDSKNKKEASKIAASFAKAPVKLPEIILDEKTEFNHLQEAKEFLQRETGAEIFIEKEADSKHDKAKQAMPGKPAIVVS